MLIKSEFDVAGSPDKVWEFFNDIPLVASCLPGADISEQVGEDEYAGTVVIKAGPVKLDFTGEATIKERDDAAKRIVVEASGADVKGRGQAVLLVDAVVTASASGSTVQVDQDLHLSGAAAQYGRGLVQDVTAILLDDFATNMRRQLAAVESGVAVDTSASSSASGTTIALRAMRMSLVRVFRRFFMPYPSTSN
ncbi:MAG: SRPBCC family protein [Acidimicrobiia bacterium]